MLLQFISPVNGLFLTRDVQRVRANSRGPDPRLVRCPDCGAFLNKYDVDFDLWRKPAGGPMVSLTVDGFYIATPSFKARYDDEGFYGLNFRPLSCGYFEIRPTRPRRLLCPVVPDEIFEQAVGAVKGLNIRSFVRPVCPSCRTPRHIRGYGAPVIAAAEPAVGEREITGGDVVAGPGEFPWISLIAGDGVAAAHKRKKFGGVSMLALNPVAYESDLDPSLATLLGDTKRLVQAISRSRVGPEG